jgi:hypothetical protein
MIKTTSADKVQERRSESSRLCMGILSAPGGYPHCDRDHKLPGWSVKTSSALQLRTQPQPIYRIRRPLKERIVGPLPLNRPAAPRRRP